MRAFADAAMADCASISTSLALLIESEARVLIDQEMRVQIRSAIKGKVASAIFNLQAVDKALGGEA